MNDNFLNSLNAPYVAELFFKFKEDSNSIDQSWIDFFQTLNDDELSLLGDFGGPEWKKRPSNVIDDVSFTHLKGSTIDYKETVDKIGFVIDNPNKPIWNVIEKGCQQLLDEQINPQVAMHNGRIDVISFNEDDGILYIEMKGGINKSILRRTMKDDLPIEVTNRFSKSPRPGNNSHIVYKILYKEMLNILKNDKLHDLGLLKKDITEKFIDDKNVNNNNSAEIWFRIYNLYKWCS